ncbi:cyclopropane mycolic acid synthase family methyltransferase [Antrihabitans sp. YC2-6]|uniref:cyclopropane mycolic acid synthase family methyltransferase n=1 Tax=Antrihabitans sp. YC2-6 TaxID=2799498 RepID=UPI0018F34AA6|nr:cyclopropane mycolic acid synthase family methyltransferase [Antrihabitans sp. YC2-6]MBJ8347377.1 class I SAM-dependent methyltransferase [Antrihabitans sp. YC2-6]
MPERLLPFYDDVQAHYDLSDDFFATFLDPTRTYSCAYFSRDDMTLEQAQLAKIDLALGKCDLRPGMTLLDVGCGWGSTMMRARDHFDVDVIGLTLSRNQFTHVTHATDSPLRNGRTAEVRLEGWEDFDEPVDRIVSIGAFEHFRRERYGAFFERCHSILPPDGRMLLHTIVQYNRHEIRAKGLPINREVLEFANFINAEIFPGGQLPEPEWVVADARAAGFVVERIHPLRLHYARTLDHWCATLREHRDEAIAAASPAAYDTYVKYLGGTGDYFRNGYIDVMQFSLAKAPGRG